MSNVTAQTAPAALWKAIADNKVSHAANLLEAFPTLKNGQTPKEVENTPDNPSLGWYGRAISQIPLLNRVEETQSLYARGLETLDFLKEQGFPNKGIEEFADNIVLKRVLRAPQCPYGAWFVENNLISHQELMTFITGQTPAPARKSFTP